MIDCSKVEPDVIGWTQHGDAIDAWIDPESGDSCYVTGYAGGEHFESWFTPYPQTDEGRCDVVRQAVVTRLGVGIRELKAM